MEGLCSKDISRDEKSLGNVGRSQLKFSVHGSYICMLLVAKVNCHLRHVVYCRVFVSCFALRDIALVYVGGGLIVLEQVVRQRNTLHM